MTVDSQALREALSLVPTAVTIVATRHVGGGACGLTANAFMSVSLEPPLVAVALDRGSRTLACIEAHERFSINVLAGGQEELARRFAERRDDKFEGVPYREGADGVPLVEGAVVSIECRIHASVSAGDHVLFIGSVEFLGSTAERPLLFHGRTYRPVERPVASA